MTRFQVHQVDGIYREGEVSEIHCIINGADQPIVNEWVLLLAIEGEPFFGRYSVIKCRIRDWSARGDGSFRAKVIFVESDQAEGVPQFVSLQQPKFKTEILGTLCPGVQEGGLVRLVGSDPYDDPDSENLPEIHYRNTTKPGEEVKIERCPGDETCHCAEQMRAWDDYTKSDPVGDLEAMKAQLIAQVQAGQRQRFPQFQLRAFDLTKDALREVMRNAAALSRAWRKRISPCCPTFKVHDYHDTFCPNWFDPVTHTLAVDAMSDSIEEVPVEVYVHRNAAGFVCSEPLEGLGCPSCETTERAYCRTCAVCTACGHSARDWEAADA